MCGLAMVLLFPPAGFPLGDFGEKSEISLTEMTSQQRAWSLVVKATEVFRHGCSPSHQVLDLAEPLALNLSQLPVLL